MDLELEPNTLDPTTLVTFIFRTPPEVRTVELLGSWDNFNIPYRMHHDRRRGNGFWSGCFKFEDIVFDGDDLTWIKPRSGGLRQGGTYWYYYRLNYDVDSFDERQPLSTSCPLLPGQKVNVLDVPMEMIDPPERCRSAYADIIGSLAETGEQHTMEPGDKFASVEAPPLSKIHARCLSDEALDGRLERSSAPLIVVKDTVSPIQSSHSWEENVNRRNDTSASTEEKSGSRDSSCYSQDGTGSTPVSPCTAPRRKHSVADDEEDLPEFPYPDSLGPTFLGSGATLFPSPSGNIAAEQRSREDSSTVPLHLQITTSQTCRQPVSTEDFEQDRPQLYSLPNLEIGEYLSESQLGSPTSPMSPATDGFGVTSPTVNYDDYSPNALDTDNYDLISPTFSAATLSSAGQNTPFRLSAQNSRRECTRHDSAQIEDESLVDISERLRALDANEGHHRSQSTERTSYDLQKRLNPRSFINYSLPTIASESTHSLVKTASNPSVPPRSQHDAPMSSMLFSGTRQRHSIMTEDLFSELDFLASSIV